MSTSDNRFSGSGSLREPGSHPVDAPVTCVLTRFGLHSARHLLPSYREYRRVVREVERAQVPGFLRAAFLVENPTTWYSLSLWAGDSSIPHFGSKVMSHVHAGNRVFGRLNYGSDGPELWSTRWRLSAVSHNLSWPGLDLRAVLGDGGGGPDAG
jgi:hypothetical protein